MERGNRRHNQFSKTGSRQQFKHCKKSIPILDISLSEAVIQGDDQGSLRVRKRRGMKSRDDVAMAGVLAAGAFERDARAPARELIFSSTPLHELQPVY